MRRRLTALTEQFSDSEYDLRRKLPTDPLARTEDTPGRIPARRRIAMHIQDLVLEIDHLVLGHTRIGVDARLAPEIHS